MPTVRVNGINRNYIEAGSGDPLLLIMGSAAIIWPGVPDAVSPRPIG